MLHQLGSRGQTRAIRARRLRSDGKVEDHDALEVRDDDQLHTFVLGVREIGVAALRGIERHNEAVRESIIQTLGALVDTVLHGKQAGDLPDHATHLSEAHLNLGRGDALLEDKSSVVVDHGVRGQGDRGTW